MPGPAASVFPTSLRSRSTSHTLVVSVSRLATRELSTVSTVVNTMTRNLFDESRPMTFTVDKGSDKTRTGNRRGWH